MKKQPETMGEIMFVTGESTTGKLQTGSMFVILFASFGYLMLFKYDFQNVGLSGGETAVLFGKKKHS